MLNSILKHLFNRRFMHQNQTKTRKSNIKKTKIDFKNLKIIFIKN